VLYNLIFSYYMANNGKTNQFGKLEFLDNSTGALENAFVGLAGGISIQSLEQKFGNKWHKSAAEAKFFQKEN
jgi:hypothetical protein